MLSSCETQPHVVHAATPSAHLPRRPHLHCFFSTFFFPPLQLASRLGKQLQKYGRLCAAFALEMCYGWRRKRQRPDSGISGDKCRKVTPRQSFQRARCCCHALISCSLQVCLHPVTFILPTAGEELRLASDIQMSRICILDFKIKKETRKKNKKHPSV